MAGTGRAADWAPGWLDSSRRPPAGGGGVHARLESLQADEQRMRRAQSAPSMEPPLVPPGPPFRPDGPTVGAAAVGAVGAGTLPPYAQTLLEEMYRTAPTPTAAARDHAAQQLGVPPATVSHWFQQRRGRDADAAWVRQPGATKWCVGGSPRGMEHTGACGSDQSAGAADVCPAVAVCCAGHGPVAAAAGSACRVLGRVHISTVPTSLARVVCTHPLCG
jgi:hypothetical protein